MEMNVDPKVQLYVKGENDKEREVSDGKYAPIILWTGFLGMLAIFAAAVVAKLLNFIP